MQLSLLFYYDAKRTTFYTILWLTSFPNLILINATFRNALKCMWKLCKYFNDETKLQDGPPPPPSLHFFLSISIHTNGYLICQFWWLPISCISQMLRQRNLILINYSENDLVCVWWWWWWWWWCVWGGLISSYDRLMARIKHTSSASVWINAN